MCDRALLYVMVELALNGLLYLHQLVSLHLQLLAQHIILGFVRRILLLQLYIGVLQQDQFLVELPDLAILLLYLIKQNLLVVDLLLC